MRTTYRNVSCRWQSGERYEMLVDAETGLPQWWPLLHITTQVRNAGRSVATMEAALVIRWFSDSWPDGLHWPLDDIGRPARSTRRAA